MLKFNTRPLLFAAGAGILGLASLPGKSLGATQTDADALKEHVRLMQQQMEELKKEVQALRHDQQTAPGSSAPAKPPATPAPSEGAAPATKEIPAPTPKTAKE